MRRWSDRLLTGLSGLSALGAAAVLVGIVGAILWQGWPAVSWRLVTSQASADGASGGVLGQLLGTLLLVATAEIVAAPAALALALLQGVYLRRGAARRHLRLGLYLWNGVPSVVMGLLGLLVFGVVLGWGKSWLAGGLVLGLMIVPTLTVALLERIEAIPRHYLEAASALGLSRSRVVRSVVLRQSRGGLVTGSFLGLARAAGETAPILFTAAVFSGAGLPTGIRDSPVLALPYHVFVLAQDSFAPGAAERVWAAAVVLLALVLLLSLAALPARLRSREEAQRA